ncbi:MAG: hypothetical protein LBQ12_00110 [Deltaproteobacteria bacterium]|nr:hypothetical protein [Deltaproteobacteria bacterium]
MKLQTNSAVLNYTRKNIGLAESRKEQAGDTFTSRYNFRTGAEGSVHKFKLVTCPGALVRYGGREIMVFKANVGIAAINVRRANLYDKLLAKHLRDKQLGKKELAAAREAEIRRSGLPLPEDGGLFRRDGLLLADVPPGRAAVGGGGGQATPGGGGGGPCRDGEAS